MNPTTIFKTAFIKMTRNPEEYAEKLEAKLNELTRAGWQVVRIESDWKKGALVLTSRLDTNEAGQEVPDLPPFLVVLDDLLRGQAPQAHPPLNPHSKMIVTQILGSVAAPGPGTEEEKRTRAIEAACRKHTSAVLRATVDDIHTVVGHHRQHEHGGDGACEFAIELEAIAKGLKDRLDRNLA